MKKVTLFLVVILLTCIAAFASNYNQHNYEKAVSYFARSISNDYMYQRKKPQLSVENITYLFSNKVFKAVITAPDEFTVDNLSVWKFKVTNNCENDNDCSVSITLDNEICVIPLYSYEDEYITTKKREDSLK